jgi:RNA polymerase sigma-70 factor (ECF subfamily)
MGEITVTEQDLFALTRFYLAKRGEDATAEERSAWQEFYATYEPIIRVAIRRVSPDAHMADDLAQEEWLIIVRSMPKWRFDCTNPVLDARVRLIARRLAVRRSRWKFKRRTGSLTPEQAEAIVDERVAPDADLEEFQLHEKFRSVALELAMQLAQPARSIVISYCVEGCTIRDIAQHLNIGEKTVRGILRRKKSRIRDALRRAGVEVE